MELRQMLNYCQKYHEKCRTNRKLFSPKRLIYIEERDGKFSLRVRLRTGLDMAGPSAALSYCWGGDQPGKTTKSRVEAYSRTIPWENIGKTIQDAVEVANNLGLSYLWVDAFCIVQDDQDDIHEEIPQMPDIYNQAVVTIVASRAQACADGFLQYPPLENIVDPIIPLKLRLSRFSGDLEATAFSLKREYYCSPPTETRGWCFQEKWLSVRLLEFEYERVHWSCASMEQYLGEAQPAERLDRFQEHYRRFMISAQESDSEFTDLSETYTSTPVIHRLWRRTIGKFTCGKLSKPEDRAIAISGLAQMFSRKLQDAYYAGLWGKSLPLDLLWQTRARKAKPIPRLQNYQGPSWSWFSGIQPISFEFHQHEVFECQIDVLNVKVSLDSELNCYGGVREGRITMKGHLRRARIINPNVSRQSRVKYDHLRHKSSLIMKSEEAVPHDAFGEYEIEDYILMDPECPFIRREADAEEHDEVATIRREPTAETGMDDTICITQSLHVGFAREHSTLDAGETHPFHPGYSSDSSDWSIPLGTLGGDLSTPSLPFSRDYDLDRFGTLVSGRMQPDALETEFICGSSSEKDYIEVELLEFGKCVSTYERSGPIGLVLREVSANSPETLSRRKFSRLGTFRFEETYAALRPPALDATQWRKIVRRQLDSWFSGCDEEVIELL